mmetsp:Transcript_7966/g.32898  ORF Transcript_7966/g.32898 Transcript_7966/m.32898 type:complete len:123 (-) Transcript_7966:845-1213(-)
MERVADTTYYYKAGEHDGALPPNKDPRPEECVRRAPRTRERATFVPSSSGHDVSVPHYAPGKKDEVREAHLRESDKKKRRGRRSREVTERPARTQRRHVRSLGATTCARTTTLLTPCPPRSS